MEGLRRRSWGSVERQVAHAQPIIWTPWDVPVLSIKTLPWIMRQPLRGDDARLRLVRFDEAQPQLVENLIEQLPLFGREIAACFRLEQRQDVDHLLRGREIHV